ncbi:hypothetical protein H6G51_04920 [Limnothrix sp. FACHB-708]|nr:MULTISPECIES: hypothetical protein [unclassified Limnothrix]MBD2552612.1 hypothetical protein [Limnothrix sp. FACHB-708]MBD2589882.1 hypothetical protein [Limnothrix sp. FACHB-406]
MLAHQPRSGSGTGAETPDFSSDRGRSGVIISRATPGEHQFHGRSGAIK